MVHGSVSSLIGAGNVSIIYVQPNGAAMRMLIADYEHGELDLVRMELNGERLAHWLHDPEGTARRHDYGCTEFSPRGKES